MSEGGREWEGGREEGWERGGKEEGVSEGWSEGGREKEGGREREVKESVEF